MCNGESGRLSQGGTIAILCPPHSEYGHTACDGFGIRWHLLFRNNIQAERRTLAEFRGVEERHMDVVRKCWVMIHYDGDITGCTMPSAGYKPFYSFPINAPFLEDTGGGAVMELQRPLELGVGESGVVGRRTRNSP